MLPKSLISVAGIVLGSLGIAVCLALIVIVWVSGNRFEGATERLFGGAERALIVSGDCLARTRERIAVARSSADEIERSLAGWTNQDASRRDVLKQSATETAEKLVDSLEQSDRWLEVVESSVRSIGELFPSGATATAATGTASAELAGEIAALRGKIAEAIGATARIQQRISEPIAAPLGPEDPIVRRLLAPLDSIDSRFVTVGRRFSSARGQVQELSARAQRWTLAAMIGATLFLLWMAAGQLAGVWLARTTHRNHQT